MMLESHQEYEHSVVGEEAFEGSTSPAAVSASVSSADETATWEEERFSEVALSERAHHAMKSLQLAMMFSKSRKTSKGSVLSELLQRPEIKEFLVALSRVSMFDSEEIMDSLPDDLSAAGILRQLRYCFVRTPLDLASDLEQLAQCKSFTYMAKEASQLMTFVKLLPKDVSRAPLRRFIETDKVLSLIYERSLHRLAHSVPHAIFPTSAYRESRGKIWSTGDASHVETQMDLSYRAKIRVTPVLKTDELASYYVSFGRVVCVFDKKLEPLYLKELTSYFTDRGVEFHLLSYRVWEKDKHIGTVEKILSDLKSLGVSRNEPVLIVGGGVITDLGGFACALYHRSTPYIQLCTSIVSGIDAGPSPRTCCDGHGYKNIFGAYHPPIVTFTDRTFWKTLEPGLIRHGIAEIIKMAVMTDIKLFKLLEQAGRRLVETKFGTLCPEDTEFCKLCDKIVGLALADYVKAEYENLWETHQLRPHAYGHTWSPGFELPAGLLHGHAIGVGMGLSTHMAYDEGFVTKSERDRVLRLFNEMEISFYNPIIHKTELLWACQKKMVEKRGGNLCAPVPRKIGRSGYIQNMPRERLERLVKEYLDVCAPYPRNGVGVEPKVTVRDFCLWGCYKAIRLFVFLC